MGSKAFIWLIVAIAAIGAGVGVGLVAANGGGEPETSATGPLDLQAPQAGDDGTVGSSFAPDGDGTEGSEASDGDHAPATGGRQRPGGGGLFGGGTIEPITGTIASLGTGGLTLETTEGMVEVPLAADTPVQLRKTVAEAAGDLVPGAEVTAILVRTPEGTIDVRNITLGGGGFGGRLFGGGFGGGGDGSGGGFGGGGFGGSGTTEFNAVTGTIVSLADGVLTVENDEGSVETVVTDDTPVTISRVFAEAGDDLAVGTQITVIGQRAEDGTYQAFTVTTGALELQDGGFGGFGGGRRGQRDGG